MIPVFKSRENINVAKGTTQLSSDKSANLIARRNLELQIFL